MQVLKAHNIQNKPPLGLLAVLNLGRDDAARVDAGMYCVPLNQRDEY